MSGYDAADLSEKIKRGKVDANIDAVLADTKPVGNILLAAERAELEEGVSPLVAAVSRTSHSDMLRGARQGAHVASMNAATGLEEQSIDATGYDRLIKMMKPAAQQILIKGPKGSGKTVAALDLTRELYAAFEGHLSVFTNIKGPDELECVTFGETTSELLEWVRDTPGEKLAVLDEISTSLNAHANPGGQVRQTVSRFINALRKGEGGSTRLMLIGHEHDTDVAAILRTQSDVVLEKAGKADEGLADRANVYDGWKKYLEQDEKFTVRGLRDVASSSKWGADTNYFAYFEIDLDNPHEQIQRGKLVHDWETYQDDHQDDHQDAEKVRCAGETSKGTPCQQLTSHESGYCTHHRWQADDEDELEDDADQDAIDDQDELEEELEATIDEADTIDQETVDELAEKILSRGESPLQSASQFIQNATNDQDQEQLTNEDEK